MSKPSILVNERKSFGKLREIMRIPNLIDVQLSSFKQFLQAELPPDKREARVGLQSVFTNTFPIQNSNGDLILEFVKYSFGDIKYSEMEAVEKDLTYSIPLKATIRLVYTKTGEVREKEIFMGDLPMMTNRGTFIINGAERVVVSQIHKSPGVVFSYDSRKSMYQAKIIPDKGAWLEFELDIKKELLYVKIDRKKRILITTLLRAIGFETNFQILSKFYKINQMKLSAKNKAKLEQTNEPIHLAEDIYNPDTNEIVYEGGAELIPQDLDKIESLGIAKIKLLDSDNLKANRIVLKCLEKDDVKTKFDAISKLHSVTRPGEPTTFENAEKEFQNLFFSPKRYDLGVVGRYKFNQKLYDSNENQSSTLSPDDIIHTIEYLLQVFQGDNEVDDIDHLGNRRIRTVGELLVNQLKVGFARMERAIKERMNTEDTEEITPQKLISIKPITAIIKEFFGSSQLSQFMDQTNPLSELTHKRRLNALGPGGLSRERAGFEVRDVHYTHYGRMCPIETPEGPNIGLILSLCNYARINEYGFLVTPYRKVIDRKITDDYAYLTAIEEDRYFVGQANLLVNEKNEIQEKFVIARQRGEFRFIPSEQLNFVDISPKQIISVSASLIPFLEHDDANRALMGSNMQRQAVPLMTSEAPYVGTGMEGRAAIDSGVCIIAKRAGEVIKASSTEIHVLVDEEDEETPVDIYQLIKYKRTNQNTCFSQRPVIKKGEHVEAGELLADGPACENGELALGKNILVAFMTWEGYNYEDAILLSERLVKDDVFTSIHIEEFEIEARETKLGSEKITKDIPNLSEEAFRNLDEHGIVRVGAKVEPGDILVGKVTPKGETDLTPEYKLLHSIFGEKAREVRDTSLRVPHGVSGVVTNIHVFKRENGDDLSPGVEELVKVSIAQRRKIQEGDKMAGRHGNKGVVSRILPEEDMPFLPDGTPVDVVLNPLGVPSRMNIGQILETLMGWACHMKNIKIATPVFEGASMQEITEEMTKAGLPANGKSILYDGKTGDFFLNEVTVGYIYILKLAHLVDDKIHARSTGPYSLVTQQPLGGKAQFGGQRLGEMEVWALEAYGAANTLQEFLTVKSDDMNGRAKIYESIVKGEHASAPGIPESFNVLIQELRGLGLDLNIYDRHGNLLGLTDKDIENINKTKNKIQ